MKFDEIKKLNDEEKTLLLNDMDALEKIVKKSMSLKRYEHSLSVAKTAHMLAISNGTDPEKAYLAGILHDICKEMPKAEQIAILKENDPEKLDYPVSAIHGYAAKYYLMTIFDSLNEDVLDAIYNHTICERKNKLNMIIYIADKREPLRKIEDGILEYAFCDLESAYKALVSDVEKYLKDKRNEKCIRSCL